MKKKQRKLDELSGIGKAMMKDFNLLGIQSVSQLAQQDATTLYKKICKLTGYRHDPCVWDTYACAIAQAKNPKLPPKSRLWWTWSGIRKRRGIVL